MAARKIIIDTDPGQDDAFALLFALGSPAELDVIGITTVGGNVPLALTSRNALQIVELAGRSDIPVYAGCPGPMVKKLKTAEYVHGPTEPDDVVFDTIGHVFNNRLLGLLVVGVLVGMMLSC